MKCGGSCFTKQENKQIPSNILDKTNKHPCYSADAHHKYARMHLPVAPKCNISCNYCNRKFDCVNESRPGVTSEVLTPGQALGKYNLVKTKMENLSVVGIAGPGDALANWENTKKSIELIKASNPDVVFCLSTNGLLLPEYAQELISLGIKHVTVTMNCLDPEIGAKIYKFIYYKGQKYPGVEGVKMLLKNQLAGIEYLTRKGVLVKVNIVMIKDINDRHIPAIVKRVKELGVFVTNIMPLIPAPGSAFENYPQTSTKELNQMRDACQVDLPQMRHCKQCRADAIGLLGEDRSLEFSSLAEVNQNKITGRSNKKLYKIAVASKHGKLVDQHFGYAAEFAVYEGDGEVFELVENRQVEKYCTGVEECDSTETKRDTIITALTDCDAVLTMRIGYHAKEKLAKRGILSVESCDTIENGLIYAVEKLTEKEIA
ncbi:MAG: nitrogenase cofactor biosynthesis protein NifB [Clostridia bacterium]|nr:nitrogenase cofactor biosynthesis protein NifB [Clostridia bacterium]